MKCKNHPDRNAENFCSNCNIPICNDCIEETKPGKIFCFTCAMLQTLSVAGNSMVDKKKNTRNKKYNLNKIPLGNSIYFVIASSILIGIMVIFLFLGKEKPPGVKIAYEKDEKILLFMADSAIRRYYHNEGKKYPDKLSDLIPRYLRLSKKDTNYLNSLSYKKDDSTGYSLSLVNPKPGTPNIVLSPQGIKNDISTKEIDNVR